MIAIAKHMKPTLISMTIVATLLSGCAQVAQITNKGGDTTCSDFSSADEKTQNETITKMLKDEGKNAPANLELAGNRFAIQTYCRTVGKPDSKISEVPHL